MNPVFATSQDGAAWDVKHFEIHGSLWSAIPDESGFLAVGDLGIVTFIPGSGPVILYGTISTSGFAFSQTPVLQSPGSLIIPAGSYYPSTATTDDLRIWRFAQFPPGTGFMASGNGIFLRLSGCQLFHIRGRSLLVHVGLGLFVARSLGFDGKRFIGAFYSLPFKELVAISTNATDWTQITGPKYFTEMSGANGLAILPGFVSTNGVDWISKPFFSQPEKVIFDGSHYVGVGAISYDIPSAVFISSDGLQLGGFNQRSLCPFTINGNCIRRGKIHGRDLFHFRS